MGRTYERKVYKNPPIEEALVDFHFQPGPEWDPTIPGKMHEHPHIKAAYPGKPRQQVLYQAEFQAGPRQERNLSLREELGRVQLVDSENPHRLITIGRDVLSVNVLRPYEGWESFRPRVETALEAYWAVVEPAAVVRIGVRYLNRLVVPLAKPTLDTYLRCVAPRVEGLPATMDGFTSRMTYRYEDGIKLIVTQASLSAPPDMSTFLVDLDVIWEASTEGDGALGVQLDAVMDMVDMLHGRECTAFEATITDEARRVFDAS